MSKFNEAIDLIIKKFDLKTCRKKLLEHLVEKKIIKKRKLSDYNKFVRICSKELKEKKSNENLMKYASIKWKTSVLNKKNKEIFDIELYNKLILNSTLVGINAIGNNVSRIVSGSM
tara:strand:+ start:743 stop:1090 length:348 start_codon:yes stop_codon:yes gene_type:complete